MGGWGWRPEGRAGRCEREGQKGGGSRGQVEMLRVVVRMMAATGRDPHPPLPGRGGIFYAPALPHRPFHPPPSLPCTQAPHPVLGLARRPRAPSRLTGGLPWRSRGGKRAVRGEG